MRLISTKPVVLQIIYYRIDYPSLLQEFTWGYDDFVPELVKTHKFLNHWHKNINAVIAEALISIADGHQNNWRPVDAYTKLN